MARCLTTPSHCLNQCRRIICRVVSGQIPHPSITKNSFNISYLNFHSHLSGTDELCTCSFTICNQLMNLPVVLKQHRHMADSFSFLVTLKRARHSGQLNDRQWDRGNLNKNRIRKCRIVQDTRPESGSDQIMYRNDGGGNPSLLRKTILDPPVNNQDFCL